MKPSAATQRPAGAATSSAAQSAVALPVGDAPSGSADLLRMAVETMSHGLCMFDASGRVLLFNRRFLDIYGFSSDVIRPGISTRELLRHSADCGNIGADRFDSFCERYEAQLARGVPFSWRGTLPNGRTILLDYRRLPEGGWVALFEDVSDVQRLENELRLQVERLDVAIDTMSYGLAMFNAEGQMTVCNDQYIRMYGLDPAVVKPGTSYRAILGHAIANGGHPDLSVEELFAARMTQVRRREHSSMELMLADGRAIQTSFRPTADGGWVADHQDITDRRRFEATLRNQNALFDAALANMSQGLIMLDQNLRLVVHNRRYLEMYGLTAGQIEPGMSIFDILRVVIAQGRFACPDIDQFFAGVRVGLQRDTAETLRQMADGRIFAIRHNRMSNGGVVVTHDDVTERQHAAELLRLQNLRFDTALENMAQGLAMFDAQLRLVVCNRRFVDMFGMDPEFVRPGRSVRELIDHAVSVGNYMAAAADRVYADYLAQLFCDDGGVTLRRLHSGRVISVRNSRMPNGGWVSTCEDITDMERAAEEVRQQNLLFDGALENMAHGLIMLDENLRLTAFNRRYVQMYGLDPDFVRPGVPLLELMRHTIERGHYPGITAEAFLADARRRMDEGHSTPVIRRLADGRSFSVRHCQMENRGWVITLEDVTDREKAAETLREQNLRFDAALENMVQGIAMYDRDNRLIVYNQRFIDIFGHDPAKTRPGAGMTGPAGGSDACDDLAGGTSLVADGDAIKDGPCDDVSTYQHELADGRTLHVMRQRMPQGGWVATYEDITERRKAEERIAHMARHDSLTNLPNRTLFREELDAGLARVAAAGGTMAVHCLDLDNFKSVNDTLGHPVGDKLLVKVAERLQEAIADVGIVARLGGDEFAILQMGAANGEAEALARRIVRIVSEPVFIDGHEINNGVSIGIAMVPVDGREADLLLKCADLALYRAKFDGRGVYRLFAPEMDERIQARRKLELDLRHALADEQFSLVFQPLVRTVDKQLVGMEALLRWNHPERGFVPPSEFIQLAEDTRLIVPIGEWVLRRACAAAAYWPASVRLAVNLSPLQLKSRGFVAAAINALSASGLAPERLELEITEAVLLRDDAGTLDMLHQLRGLGIRISMDDFGTGYSSLSYLRRFPFDKIKIDRSFVAHLGLSADGEAIVGAVAWLGSNLGIVTTAEGVETEEQFNMVRSHGCTEAQGHYISQPLPAAALPEFFARWHRGAAAA